jgi:hypothetical protein
MLHADMRTHDKSILRSHSKDRFKTKIAGTTLLLHLRVKKLTSIFISAIFLITSVGFSFSVSSCPMLQTAHLSLSTHHSCCCHGSASSDCCKHELYTIRITDNYAASSATQVSSPCHHIISLIAFATEADHINFHFANAVETVNLHSPPPLSGYERCILFRTYLI